MLKPAEYIDAAFLKKAQKKAHEVNRELCGVGGN